MAKILFWGDAGANTGFGRVTFELVNRFVDAGHEVHVVGINFRGEIEPPWDQFKATRLYVPTLFDHNDTYGFSRIRHLIVNEQPDVLFALNDVPIASHLFSMLEDVPFAPPVVLYCPIDATHLTKSWGDTAAKAAKLVTYTNFGADELEYVLPEGTPRPLVAFHGTDHMDIHPVSFEHPALIKSVMGDIIPAYSKEEVKLAYGLKDKFVILWVDRNSPRKNPAAFLKAVGHFVSQQPDVAVWMHCAANDIGGSIPALVDKYGLNGRVWMTPGLDTFTGVPEWMMNTIYNLGDIKVSTSGGEGAGLTNVEALRAGVPVILQDFSANPEMVGPGGYYAHVAYEYTTSNGCDLALPNLVDYYANLTAAYLDRERAARKAAAGAEHIKQFTWDKCADTLLQAIEEVM